VSQPRRSDATERWLQNDSLFFEQVEAGHRWALHLGALLLSRGLVVYVTPPTFREKVEDREKWKDENDLWAAKRRGRPVLLEVKSRSLPFSTPESYPYPTAYVCSARKWKLKERRPLATCLVSQATGAVLCIPTESSSTWQEQGTCDSVRGITYPVYTAPKEELRDFDWLCEKIAENS